MTSSEVSHPLRPILKNWLWEHGRIGTRFLDCATGELRFDEGKKAGFAGECAFRVSLVRSDSFANQTPQPVHEAALSLFLRAAQAGKPEAAGSPADVQRSVQETVDIALLCSYQAVAREAQSMYAQEALFDEEIAEAVFHDVRKIFVPLREQMALYDFVVFYGLPQPQLIGESPFLDWRLAARPAQPFVSVVLAPYAILVGAPSAKTRKAAPLVWTKASAMGPLRDHNALMVKQAKQWLVATQDDQLEALQTGFGHAPG